MFQCISESPCSSSDQKMGDEITALKQQLGNQTNQETKSLKKFTQIEKVMVKKGNTQVDPKHIWKRDKKQPSGMKRNYRVKRIEQKIHSISLDFQVWNSQYSYSLLN